VQESEMNPFSLNMFHEFMYKYSGPTDSGGGTQTRNGHEKNRLKTLTLSSGNGYSNAFLLFFAVKRAENEMLEGLENYLLLFVILLFCFYLHLT